MLDEIWFERLEMIAKTLEVQAGPNAGPLHWEIKSARDIRTVLRMLRDKTA